MLGISKREAEDLLHLACKNGQLSLIKNLLKAKVNINALDSKGKSSLDLAVIEGNIAVTNLLISEGANIEMKDSFALLYACENGRTKIVKILLENGADINSKINDGTSAIHLAASSGKLDLIDFLLQKGFDINCENNDRLTPLHYILLYCIHPEGKDTSLYEKSKILIERGAKIDSESSVGDTPLMLATMANDIRVVRLLISLGATVNHGKNHFKITPLHVAACFKIGENDLMIMQVLIDNGAEVDAQSGTALITPLHANIWSHGSIKSARVLLENGAKLLYKNFYGNTAFSLAIRYHNTEFINLALAFQPSLVASLNKRRDFPIEYALQLKNESALKMITYHCHKYTLN